MDATAVHNIICDNRYLTLATSNGIDVWICPLAYVFDDVRKCFYFYSALNSRHCRNIAVNPKGAIAIFNSTSSFSDAIGLQSAVDIDEVEGPELEGVIDSYFKKLFPDPKERQKWQRPESDFSGEAPQRFYRLVPKDLFLNDVEGMIDMRRKVSL